MARRQSIGDRDIRLTPRQLKLPVIELVEIVVAVPCQQRDQQAYLVIAEAARKFVRPGDTISRTAGALC